MKTTNELDNATFDLGESTYSDLAASLEHWASMFYEGAIADEHGESIAYLLYNMSKEMKRVDQV